MSVGNMCLGLYLLFVGADSLGLFTVSGKVLGILALIAGIIILVDAWHPIVWRRNPQA